MPEQFNWTEGYCSGRQPHLATNGMVEPYRILTR